MKKNSFKIILGILACLVVSFAVIYYIIFLDIEHKNVHISEVGNMILNQNTKNQNMRSAEQALKSTSGDIQKLNNAIVSTDGNIDFIEKLENTARRLGLDITIDSITLEDTPNLAGTQMVTLDVKAKVRGSWSATYTFLEQLESFPFVLHVENLALVNNPNDDGTKKSQSWQSSFEIHVLKHK